MLIPYADVPIQYGIVVERSPGRLVIKVPQRSLWGRPLLWLPACFVSLIGGLFLSLAAVGMNAKGGTIILSTAEVVQVFCFTLVIGGIVFLGMMALFNQSFNQKPAALLEVA